MKTVQRRGGRIGALVLVATFIAIGLVAATPSNSEAATSSGVDSHIAACMGLWGTDIIVVNLPSAYTFAESPQNSWLYARLTNFAWRDGKWVFAGHTQWYWTAVDTQGNITTNWHEYDTGAQNNAPDLGAQSGYNKVAITLVQREWNTGRTLRNSYEWVDAYTDWDCYF